jgi:hypothetical protein
MPIALSATSGLAFGLVRKTVGIFWWTKEFCSKQCSNNYVKECQEREKVKQFLAYLSWRA